MADRRWYRPGQDDVDFQCDVRYDGAILAYVMTLFLFNTAADAPTISLLLFTTEQRWCSENICLCVLHVRLSTQ